MILVVEEEKERILDEMEGFGSLTEADTSTLSALETQLSAQHQQPTENSADDADGKPTDIMYCIKWVGKSHMHNTWYTADELNAMDIKGQRKLKNYIQNVANMAAWMKTATPEELEFYNCRLEQARELTVTYTTVERVIEARTTESRDTEYLCKWDGLPYAAATWENASDISTKFQSKIDEHLRRNSSKTASMFSNTRTLRKRFIPYVTQPEYLPEKLVLRDYQLAGLNWLAMSWCRHNSVILADEMGAPHIWWRFSD